MSLYVMMVSGFYAEAILDLKAEVGRSVLEC